MKMKLGIIGVGDIWGSHLAAVRRLPAYELVSVCRRSRDKLRSISEELGCTGFTDYRELLAGDLDVVLVSLPHGMHCEVTLEAFEAGCHVLVEKPMAVSVGECNRMLRGADEHNKRLIVTESAAFTPGAVRTGEKFRQGKLGRFFTGSILNERFYFHESRPRWFLDAAMSGGGMFSNVGLHRLAVARACLPSLTPVAVSGSVSHVPDYEVEACTSAMVRYAEGGAMFYEEVGYYQKPDWLNVGTHLVFEEGIVSWDATTWHIMTRKGEDLEEPLPAQDAPYAPVYESMLQAIRGEDHRPKAWECAADTAVVHGAYASSKTGHEVDLTSRDWRIESAE